MRALVFTDLHLTDNPREEYRWDCFVWARRFIEKHKPSCTVILGDLTDKKDNHSATLVNRLVRELTSLTSYGPVHVLKGNHDYRDPNEPFFGFLAGLPNVTYYSKVANPTDIDPPDLWLPHTFNPIDDWAFVEFRKRSVCFLHQTVRGSRLSNGSVIEDSNVSAELFDNLGCLALSGDVHVPQRIGRIIYVGSPHPVRFGDEYAPRMMLLKGRNIKSLPVATIRRCHAKVSSVRQLSDYSLREGDHLRVSYELPRKDVHSWPKLRDQIRRKADKLKVQVFGITAILPRDRIRLNRGTKLQDSSSFERYCSDKNISNTQMEIGKGIMNNERDTHSA